MTAYSTVRTNFSLRPQYAVDLDITTSYVTGGTQVTIGNSAVKHTEVSNAPFTSGSPRSYSTPNGRAGSVTGNLAEGDSDSSWTFSFTYPGVPQYQNIWGNGFFTRFYPDSVSIGTISITASHSLLGTATSSRSGIKHVYRVSFDGNGGSAGSSSSDADAGSSITLPSASRSGYNFNGWYTAASGGSYVGAAGGSYTVNSTTTLYAQWSLATITITFDFQGGSGSPSSKTINPGDAIGTLPSASLGSYNFVGWYYSPNGQGGQVQSSTTFSSNDTIYAYYESTVVFDANGGNGGGQTVYVPKGNSITPSSYNYAAGSRSGYTFTGWSPYNSTFTPAGATTLTAQWTALTVSWTDTTLTTTGRKGDFYSSTVSASYVSYWNDGALPTGGLSFIQGTNTSGSSTSTVSGTPTTYGNISFTLTPYNQDGVAGSSYSYTIAVKDIALNWSDQLLASSLAVQDQSYTDGVAVDSGPDVTYSVNSGSLPTGLSLNSSTGAITGTPTVAGEFNFVIRATNGSNEVLDTGTLTITVEAAGGYVKVWNGSSWANGTAYVRQSGTWVEGTVKLRGASSWGDSFSS